MTAPAMCFTTNAEVPHKTPSFKPSQDENNKTLRTMEPPLKKVRFVGVDDDQPSDASSVTQGRTPMAHSPEQVEELVEKVHKRAERRKREALKSPPPPPSPEDEDEDKPMATDDLEELNNMRRRLRRMERAIKESARVELKLMNKSKKLRDHRAVMTRKYETMAHQLREMQRAQQPEGKLFQMSSLPPLLEKSRRVSTL